ncbi:MAG: hypothetical protein WBE34_18765 [Candidatus Nitrosopolaris sp.]
MKESINDFRPPSLTSYMNRPYIFKSEEEFDEIVEKAKHETSSKTDRTQLFVSNPKLGYI